MVDHEDRRVNAPPKIRPHGGPNHRDAIPFTVHHLRPVYAGVSFSLAMTAIAGPPQGGLSFKSEPLPIPRAVLWGPTSAGPPEPLGQPYPIFLHQQALRQLIVHTRSAAGKTFIGFLLGDLYQCPESGVKYVLIDQGLRVGAEVPGDQTSALLAKVWPRLQEQIPGQKRRLIGWYHNHPASSSEFTRGDIGTHMMYFAQPWQVGLVMGVEDAKPAAGWYRVSQDENWSSVRHAFYEVLSADSIDSTGKKRSHVDWANFKPYKPVTPPAQRRAAPRASTTVAMPAAAAPRARTAATTQVPRPAPAPAPAPPAPRPPAPRAPSGFQRTHVEEPEEAEEVPAPAPPPRRPSVTRAVSPPAPVEEEEAPPAVEEEEDEPRARPPARPSVRSRPRPSAFTVEPRVERPAPARPPAWKTWAMGGAGAGATLLLILAGWGLGFVQFGRVAQSPGAQDAAGAAQNTPAAEPAAPAPSRPAAPPPAQVNPALVMLDRLTDSVLGAVSVYANRRARFQGPDDCNALAEALVAVEGHWITYNAQGKPRDLVLDDRRAARDQSLYARVDTVETHFDQTTCPRP